MAVEQQLVLQTSIDDFFVRSGLTAEDQNDCLDFVEKLYPGRPVARASCQGYCSMTVFVGEETVVQFRPHTYRLDLQITSAARKVYGRLAPETRYVTALPKSGLLVYTMERIAGVCFKDLRASSPMLCRTYHLARLCREFATFLATSWHQHRFVKGLPSGLVGRSLKFRLELLGKNLPERFRPTVRHILKNLHHIEALPWVLTHGDIVAANIMVDPASCRLTGLVDWAEAEKLPFGICLYGLEEILGETMVAGFQYRTDAAELRAMFWTELKDKIPELKRSRVVETVELARDLGVLLWHGFAFDNGAINRVVEEDRDVEEIHRLDAILDRQVPQIEERRPKL